jgi:hypothetical protein
MAGRSQYFIQIMATQTRFNLNAAMEGWQNELAAQQQLTLDDRRELEKHLTDSIADLQQHGLSDEESFWLARRRIGQPQQLAKEFKKADPGKIWRERAFWMVVALLAFELWMSLDDLGLQFYHGAVKFQGEILLGWFVLGYFLSIIVFFLAQRWAVKNVAAFCEIFRTRWRFGITAMAFIAVTHGPPALEAYRFNTLLTQRWFWLNQFTNTGFPLMLLAVAIWLLPTQKQPRRTEKPA